MLQLYVKTLWHCCQGSTVHQKSIGYRFLGNCTMAALPGGMGSVSLMLPSIWQESREQPFNTLGEPCPD